MLIALRIAGLLLIVGGMLFAIASAGMPYMFSGSLSHIQIGFAAIGVGFLLLTSHAVLFLIRNGWAASGITVPGMAVFGVGLVGAWWFLFGPKANSYPRIYGIGVLLFALFVASQILPLIVRQRIDPPNDTTDPPNPAA